MTEGTADNPISLEDEETKPNDMQLMLDAARNKSLIEEALFTSEPLDLCFAVIKTTLKGDLPSRQRELNKAIIKYFKEKIKINISCEYFHPRIDADYNDPDVTLEPCQLLLYGVDLLTTSSIKDRFAIQQTNIREIIWINNSTCKLVFGTAEESKRVMEDQTKQVKIEEDDSSLPKGWFSVKPYTVYSFERQLEIRYATSKEAELEKGTISEDFPQARKLLGQHLLSVFNATDKFKEIVHEIDSHKLLHNRRRNRSPQRGNLSRSRDRFKNNSRNRREFDREERDWRGQNNHNNRYRPQTTDFQENVVVRYAHQPSNMNTSYNYGDRRNEEREYPNRERNLQQFDNSFRFLPNNRRQSNNNQSFAQDYNTGKKKYFDAPDLDSELSFNHFGAGEGRVNERDDFHLDYNQQKQQRPRRGGYDMDNSYIQRKGTGRNNKYDSNQSFLAQTRNEPRNTANNSFVLNNRNTGSDNHNQSYLVQQRKKKPQQSQDFFEFLNSANSVVSSIREANEQHFDDNSFVYQKKQTKGHKKNKEKKQLNESYFNQDSY